MKRLLWTSAVILSLGIASFAQGGGGTDDHDDSAPVQSGYAVVTPAIPGSSPLTVQEMYGFKRGTETIQTGVPVSALTTSAALFADVSSRLDRNLGVAIVNPGVGTATVTLTLRRSDGAILETRTVSIAPRRQNVQFITSLIPVFSTGGTFGGPPSNVTEYTGTLSITSSTPVSVVGVQFRGVTFSGEIPSGTAPAVDFPIILQGVGGAGAFLIPQFVTGGGWATKIVVTNPGSASVTVRLDLFTSDGVPLTAALNGEKASSFTNITIPAGGVFVFAPRDANGDDRF